MDIDCLILRIIVYYGLYIEVEELSAHCIKFRKRKKYKKSSFRVKFRQQQFSILANSFDKQQESSLEDYIQLSVIMQYNYRNDNGLLIHVSFFIIVK